MDRLFSLSLALKLFFASFLFVGGVSYAPMAAAVNCEVGGEAGCDQGIAYALCQKDLRYSIQRENSIQGGNASPQNSCVPRVISGMQAYECSLVRASTYYRDCYRSGGVVGQRYYYWAGTCAQRTGTPNAIRNWTSRCVGGCMMEMENPQTNDVGSGAWFTGNLFYGGLTCPYTPFGGEPLPEDTPPQGPGEPECAPQGTLTMCIKPNGDHCATASTGVQFCWDPITGDGTGQRTDNGTSFEGRQSPDVPPSPPNAPPPTGSGWNPPANGSGSASNAGSGGTRITNITIHTSGPTGGGGTGGGSGGGSGSGEGEEGEERGIGGGGTCDQPPTCTGSADPVTCMIAAQTWRTRCNIEKTGIPGGETGFEGVDGLPSSVEGMGVAEEVPDMEGAFDASGWAPAGQCPVNASFSTRFGSFTMDNTWACNLLDAIAALVLLAGYVSASFVLFSGTRKG